MILHADVFQTLCDLPDFATLVRFSFSKPIIKSTNFPKVRREQIEDGADCRRIRPTRRGSQGNYNKLAVRMAEASGTGCSGGFGLLKSARQWGGVLFHDGQLTEREGETLWQEHD
jgi:hypothetical protein